MGLAVVLDSMFVNLSILSRRFVGRDPVVQLDQQVATMRTSKSMS